MPTPNEYDENFHRHGLLRPVVKKRGFSQPFPKARMPSLLLRLRALFGVTFRCEILCLLGSVSEMHPSLIAKLLGQNPRSTQITLTEMARSGVIQVRTTAREKIYALAPVTLDNLLRPEGYTPWVNSGSIFRALEILWLGVSNPKLQSLDPLILASEWRRLAKQIRPLLGTAGLGQPLRDDCLFPGDKYHKVFIEDISRSLEKI